MNDYPSSNPEGLIVGAQADVGLLTTIIDLNENRSRESHNQLVAGICVSSANNLRCVDLYEENTLKRERKVFKLFESDQVSARISVKTVREQLCTFNQAHDASNL
ncbi:hypothetical protein [Methylobacterium sp. BTF04]|uniref:hypothetical protein n=1 Tax=Methylobacterium sp. BTF04 TaxID=2708300 RepID=UPI001FED543C|nr:hypothetical protein [Methylobacterium sp. BTF04]